MSRIWPGSWSGNSGYRPSSTGSAYIRLCSTSNRSAIHRIRGLVRGGLNGRVHIDDPDAAGDAGRTQRIHRQPMPEQLMVRGGQRVEQQGGARRVHAQGVPVQGHRCGFVDGRPAVHPVAERLPRQVGVVGQPVRGVAVQPAARTLQRLGGVPVVQRRHRPDAGGQQFVDQLVVERHPGAVRAALALRLQPGPGEREPVGVHAEVAQERHVLADAMVVVGCDGGVGAVQDASRLRHEHVPVRRSAAALAHGALDLERRGRHAHREAHGHPLREGRYVAPLVCHGPSTLSR